MKIDTPIIESLMDTDKYKFTMGYVFFKEFSDLLVQYKFKNRSDINLLPFKDEIIEQLKYLCSLRFTNEELEFLHLRNPYFSRAYIEFLKNLKLNFDYLDIREKDGDLYIGTHKDVPLIFTTWFEINVLTIVEEVYTRHTYPNFDYGEADKILDKKIIDAKEYFHNRANFTFADFITRRRVNRKRHETVLGRLSSELPSNCFVGTSNVYFAKKFDIGDIGTMAHEYLQVGQGLTDQVTPLGSQRFMLQKWADTYRGTLGIALTDVVGFDAFLRDFDLYFATLFSGCRHDSGDPFEWCEKLIAHYEKLGINPNSKTAVFSDSVSFPLMFKLIERFRGRINVSFGIGTNLVNDLGCDFKTLQMVMKIIECNGNPVAKISDSAGKGMCEDPEYLNYLKKVFKITARR